MNIRTAGFASWLSVAILCLGLLLSIGCSALCRGTTFYPADESVLPGCEAPW